MFEMLTNKSICIEETKVGIYKWKRDMNKKLVLPDELSQLSKDISKSILEVNLSNKKLFECQNVWKSILQNGRLAINYSNMNGFKNKEVNMSVIILVSV